jgi:MFS family permease
MESNDERPTPARLGLALAVLVSGSLLAWLLRYGTAVALPGLRADFEADAAALGAIGAAYFWPYAAMQPFAGVMSDLWGPRRTLAVWLWVAALGTLLFAFAPTYALAMVGRALGGAGVGVVLVAAFSLLARWFGPGRFATAAGLYAATGPLGGLLAAHPLAGLVEFAGWRGAFAVVAVWLAVTALGAMLVLPRSSPPADGPAVGGALRGLSQAARVRNLWPCAIHAFVALGILSAMQGLWTVPYLGAAYGLDDVAATDILQAWSIGLLLALPAWGYVADRLVHSYKATLLASVVLHALPWLYLWQAPSGWPEGGLFPLFLFIASMNGCWMPAYALVNRSAPPAVRGSALGLLNFAFFLGAACFQQSTGLLLDAQSGAGNAVEAYAVMFGLFAAALAASALALSFAREPSN